MAKFKIKDFLLNKGEKIVLGVALAGMALFVVLGISEFLSAKSPTTIAKDFESKAKNINDSIAREDGDAGVKDLEPWVKSQVSFKPIDSKHFRSAYLPFETVDTPSSKRDNPEVLYITDAQVDLVRAPMKAYEVLVTDAGVKIGLLYNVKPDKLDVAKLHNLLKEKGQQYKRQAGQATAAANQPPPTPNPMQPAPTAATPSAGFARGEGRGGGGGVPPQQATGERIEKTLRYVPVDDYDKEIQKPDVLPALSVYPIRMIVVHASFPLKEQLELIRRSLRLKTIAEAAAETAPQPPMTGQGPTFMGFEVERRIIAPNGQVYDWTPYDHVANYLSKIAIRKFADQPDDGLLSYFLRYDQMMAMPLPGLAANLGVYPSVRLAKIVEGYNMLLAANKKPVDPSERQRQFSGTREGNPFAPSTSVDTGGLGSAAGYTGNTSGPAVPVGRAEGRSFGPPPATMTPAAGGSPTMPSTMPELEHLLIRFLDVDVRPGFTYQYRIRVKMKNPNYNKPELVARKEDAKQEVLWGPWATIANAVSVPYDDNLYASDPIAYAQKVRDEFKDPKIRELLDNRDGEEPVVQFQRWLERVTIEPGKSEPAGYWVVAEVPVRRGEFIGHRQLVTLPMWSSEKVDYILQEVPKYTIKNAREKPKGLIVDFTTDTLLVDYEGGKVRTTINDRTYTDEADTEIMLLKPDGTVIVRNAGLDREDEDRKKREESWQKWLKEIKDRSRDVTLTDPNSTLPFGGPRP